MLNGSFTFSKSVSKTVIDSDMQQSCKSHVTVTTVHASATLGSMTTNGNDPLSVKPPKVAKARTSVLVFRVVVASVIALTFTNVNMA
jgi:hypothetical protein